MRYFLQEKHNTCALACIRMLLSHFDMQVPSEDELGFLLQSDGKGTLVSDALLYLQRLGFRYEHLYHNELPCEKPIICLIQSSLDTHMVIVVLKDDEKLLIYDPNKGVSERDVCELKDCRFVLIDR